MAHVIQETRQSQHSKSVGCSTEDPIVPYVKILRTSHWWTELCSCASVCSDWPRPMKMAKNLLMRISLTVAMRLLEQLLHSSDLSHIM